MGIPLLRCVGDILHSFFVFTRPGQSDLPGCRGEETKGRRPHMHIQTAKRYLISLLLLSTILFTLSGCNASIHRYCDWCGQGITGSIVVQENGDIICQQCAEGSSVGTSVLADAEDQEYSLYDQWYCPAIDRTSRSSILLEFFTNGTVLYSYKGYSRKLNEPLNYSILDDSRMLLDGDTYSYRLSGYTLYMDGKSFTGTFYPYSLFQTASQEAFTSGDLPEPDLDQLLADTLPEGFTGPVRYELGGVYTDDPFYTAGYELYVDCTCFLSYNVDNDYLPYDIRYNATLRYDPFSGEWWRVFDVSNREYLPDLTGIEGTWEIETDNWTGFRCTISNATTDSLDIAYNYTLYYEGEFRSEDDHSGTYHLAKLITSGNQPEELYAAGCELENGDLVITPEGLTFRDCPMYRVP